ncbi:MAG: fibronectin type III domain-containing protein [Bacteroides sp.]|nr:fibronectin type III domain-containing protein [Ruminococcus flavefaciens]MCM1555637.1 fibronectin type III domain-containing protein [Bacteroides sp.]
MKKLFFGFFMALISMAMVVAQDASQYVFEGGGGSSYTAMSGNGIKTLAESEKVKGADFRSTFFNDTEQYLYKGSQRGMTGIDIGFDFYFEGMACDKFVACGAGFIMLAPKTDNDIWITGNPNVFTYGRGRTIGAAVDLSVIGVEGTKICYRLDGSEAEKNRVLTVEFTGLTHASGSADKLNFQIKLHETTNQIELFFDYYNVPSSPSSTWGIGIEGVGGKRLRIGGDKLEMSKRWINGEALTDINEVAGDGTMFMGMERFAFSVPALPDCAAPTKTVTAVKPQAKENIINLAVTLGATGTADAYLVVASSKKEAYTLQDERTYSVGDAISDGKVIAVGNVDTYYNSFTASHSGLEPNTKYYYSIFLYNNLQCSGGPVYGSAYVDSAITGTLPPAALRVTSIADNGITLSVTPNRWNDTVLIACSNQDLLPLGQDLYGKPAGDMKVGDTLWKGKNYGGTLIYKGLAANNIVYNTQVPAYTPYFFIAYSRTAEGAYSASYILTDTISKAKLPFKEDFRSMNAYKVPCGWYGTSAGYTINTRSTYRFVGAMMDMSNPDSVYTANLVFPAMNFPEDRDLRLVFEYNMNHGTEAVGTGKADWHENDSIVFEVSADGGRTFEPAYAITGRNADAFKDEEDYKQKRIAIKGFYDIQNAQLRIRYVAHYKEGKLYNYIRFRNFELFAMDECDYPALVQVIDSTVKADRVTVRWAGGAHNETQWNLSHALRQDDGTLGEWSQPVKVSGSSYEIKGLRPNRKYAVRMQAVCYAGSESQWVSTNFNSGWTPAFIENFNNLEAEEYYNTFYAWYMPFGWTVANQSGSAVPESLVFNEMNQTRLVFDNWKKGPGQVQTAVVPGKTNASVVFAMPFYTGSSSVMRLPEISVRANEQPVLVFDYAYGDLEAFDDGSYKFLPVNAATENYDKMFVWVSTDGGNTFAPKSAVRTFEYAELAQNGDSAHVEIPLDSYNGNICVAFGIHTIASGNVLWLDNIGVVYKCPTAQNLAIRDGSLTNTSVTLDWWEDPTRSEWKAICRGNGTETNKTVQGSSLTFDNLEEATAYMILVGQDCADTSKWSRVSFTTGGAPCDPVSGVTVSEVTKATAKLQWTGSAERYRVRIRPVGGSTYSYYETETNSFVLQNLKDVTSYEGGVQSVCGLAVGDTANYVAFENFTTLAVTCFAPTDIEVVERNHYSAVMKWKGNADKYQVECRLADDLLAEPLRITVADTFAKMEVLQAENLYQARVRSICAANDTSDWSDWTEFSTAVAPDCPEPSNLRAETLTATSAHLVWSSPEEGAAFALRYSLASPVSWNNIESISDTAYELKDLKPETVYLWSVMSVCKGGKTSDWAQRVRFQTNSDAAIETNDESKFSVYAGKGQLHVMNPSFMYIERIRLYTLDGRYTDYPVRSNDNVLLTTRLSSCVVIVEVQSVGKQYREKVFLP